MILSITHRIYRQALVFLALLMVFGLGAIYLGQDNNYDLLNYHFYNGFAALHQRLHYDIAAAGMQTYMNPVLDIINYSLIILHKPLLTIFLLGAFTGVTAFFLWRIFAMVCVDLQKPYRYLYAFFALAIGMTGAGGLAALGTTMNDDKICLLVIVALYCLLKGINSDKALRYVIASALIMGMAAGFKLPAACYVLGMLGALYFTLRLEERCYFFCSVFIGFSALGFLFVDGLWMYTVYQAYQSPLYPYFNNVFHSPYAPFISFNFKPTPTSLHTMDYLFMPLRLALTKAMYAAETPMRDMRLAMVFFIGGVFYCWKIWQGRRADFFALQSVQQRNFRLISSFFILSYLAWVSVFAVYRYMLPLEILTGLLLVFFVLELFTREGWRLIILVLLVSLFSINTYYPRWGRIAPSAEYFSMVTPALPANAQIVLATQPLAYVAPFFASSIRFYGMPFIQLGVTQQAMPRRVLYLAVMKHLKQALQQHQPIYLLSFVASDGNTKRTLANLGSYQIIPDSTRCMEFKTNAGSPLKLCPLELKL